MATTTTTKTNAIQVFLIDDHPVMRQGMSQIIDDLDDMQVCGEAEDAQSALELVAAARPDVCTVDISLGDGNGVELIKQIKAEVPATKMLVLTMHDESLFAERAVRAGALGFVNKNEPTTTIIDALRQVASGRIWLSRNMTDRMMQLMSGTSEPAASSVEKLSDRELAVFEMIGRGMITKQIAAQLGLSPKTIETYRENIKSKMGLANGTELTRHAVKWVLEQG